MATQACPHAAATLAMLHGTFASRASGEIGQTAGIVIQYGVTPTSTRVRAENIGNPAEGLIHCMFKGIPKMEGELPGASGAQFRGELRHPPPPNPHESPSRRFWVASTIESTALSSNQRLY